jgi:hypothetical protein
VITALTIDLNLQRGSKEIWIVKGSFKCASADVLSCGSYSEDYGFSLFDEFILYVEVKM